jgi:hypothetical protein
MASFETLPFTWFFLFFLVKGIAIEIVQRGEVVVERGRGKRARETREGRWRRRPNGETSTRKKQKLESHLGKHVLGDPGLFRRGHIMAADALPRRGDFLLRDGEGERVSGKTEN